MIRTKRIPQTTMVYDMSETRSSRDIMVKETRNQLSTPHESINANVTGFLQRSAVHGSERMRHCLNFNTNNIAVPMPPGQHDFGFDHGRRRACFASAKCPDRPVDVLSQKFLPLRAIGCLMEEEKRLEIGIG
jgi:hypothetical protein